MKKNDKAPKTDKSDSDQKTRVLLEEIHHQVKTIAEGHGGLVQKFDEHDKKLNKIASELGTAKMALMTIIGDVKTLRSDVDTVKSDVKTLRGDVDMIKCDLKTINIKLDDDVANHEKRITKLEEKVLV